MLLIFQMTPRIKGLSRTNMNCKKSLVYISAQTHARFIEYRKQCCGTSVATCWLSLTDGCSLFFYMAVRSHTSHLFHIAAGSQHGPEDLLGRVLQDWNIFRSISFIQWGIKSKLIRLFDFCLTPPKANKDQSHHHSFLFVFSFCVKLHAQTMTVFQR